jgi:3-deoxy-D-arabino-heptulosonate 7-phosphate (DAHP) synthase
MTFMTDNEPKRPVLPFSPATAGMRTSKTSQNWTRMHQGHHRVNLPSTSYAFFPIRGTAVESLITRTRQNVHNIIQGSDDRLLVVIGLLHP